MVPTAVHLPALADGNGLAETRERFLTAESVRPSEVREPILASWWRSRQWNVAADRVDAALRPRSRPRHPADPQRHAGAAQPARAPGGPADQRHPHRRRGRRADPDDRRPRPGAAPRRGPARARASATPRSTSAPTGSAPRWRAASPLHVFGHEHYAEDLEDLACAGVPIHAPDLRQGGRRGRPDLLAQRRRPAADRAGQDHRRPDHPGHARRQQRAGAPAAAGVPAGLPAHQRDRAGPEQRRRHDERVRPPGARPGRPGACCSARPPRRWPAGRRGRCPSSCPAGSRPGCTAARSAATIDVAGGVVHVKLIEPASQRPAADARRQAPDVPARPGRRRARCGCAAAGRSRPSTTPASGSPWRASPAWAS